MALGRMGLVYEGIADLGVFIQRHPDSSVAYTKRGVRNIWRNNLVEAERDLTRAVQLDPFNAEARDDLGVVHAKHSITRTPLLRATKVHGQFLGRDFNPLAKLLLLRTSDPICYRPS